jgi:hypothetical protein
LSRNTACVLHQSPLTEPVPEPAAPAAPPVVVVPPVPPAPPAPPEDVVGSPAGWELQLEKPKAATNEQVGNRKAKRRVCKCFQVIEIRPLQPSGRVGGVTTISLIERRVT